MQDCSWRLLKASEWLREDKKLAKEATEEVAQSRSGPEKKIEEVAKIRGSSEKKQLREEVPHV